MNLGCKSVKVLVCNGPSCVRKFSGYVSDRAEAEAGKLDSIEVGSCNCCGNCEKGVSVRVEKNKKTVLHSYVDPIKVAQIIKNSTK